MLEVHLFDFDQEIYGAHLTVHLLHKLRDEAKFDSVEALTAQIARDVQATQAYFEGKN
ncbi:MAG: riboflavin kinase [Rhodocyclaceae bacterium]|nr:riboflavin kinase [Rhodocyclaceae bacterium]